MAIRAKTRLQVQIKTRLCEKSEETTNRAHCKSTLDVIRKIIADEGASGLYSGMFGSLTGVASMNFVYFYWYLVVRRWYNRNQCSVGPPNTAVELSLGAIAGALAQLFTTPLGVITTRQQTQTKNEKKGIMETAGEIINEDNGWTGLWSGFKASLVLVVNPAITYGSYQRLRVLLFPKRASLRPWESFGQYQSTYDLAIADRLLV